MNKKYIIGGILFWASVSGYMGLRVLNSYIDDAVYAALSVIPAKAEDIRFSFLDNSLRIKGIEYEIPDDTIIHKGTIESVEVKDFNRKVVFVNPVMPPYDADTLPRVAESIVITGIKDFVHEGNSKVEKSIATLTIDGWHQRVGMLLDRYNLDGVGEKFYEELFRCRVDDLKASHIHISKIDDKIKGGITASISELSLPGGIKAPRGDKRVGPVSVRMDGVNFAYGGGEISVNAGLIDLRDLRSPEPAQLARLMELSRSIKEGKADLPEEAFAETLAKSYASVAPFSFIGVQGLSAKRAKDAVPVTLADGGYSFSCQAGKSDSSLRLNDLHLSPELFGDAAGLIKRFAPSGLKIDAESKGSLDADDVSSEGSFEIEGLGKLHSKLLLEGDWNGVSSVVDKGKNEEDILSVLNKVAIKYGKVDYADSGMLALVLAFLLEQSGEKPEGFLSEVSALAKEMEEGADPFAKRLGKALGEQVSRPGVFSVEFSPEKAMDLQQLVMQGLLQPEMLPLTITSVPGKQPLMEQLAK